MKILLSSCFITFFPFRKLQLCSYRVKFGYTCVIRINTNKKAPAHLLYLTELSNPLFIKPTPHPPTSPSPIYSGCKSNVVRKKENELVINYVILPIRKRIRLHHLWDKRTHRIIRIVKPCKVLCLIFEQSSLEIVNFETINYTGR